MLRPLRDHSVPIGQTFGQAIVLRKVPVSGKCRVLCKCACGAEFETLLASLKTGNTSSCGCALTASRTKHGMHKSPEYAAWAAMIQRCGNPRCQEWKNYGARGIAVCAAWRGSFESFLASVGIRPSPQHSLDRWPDHNGNYEPGNVRWATPTQQSRNTRRNVLVIKAGVLKTLPDAAEEAGISSINARNRRDLGWPDDRLFETVRQRGKYRARAK